MISAIDRIFYPTHFDNWDDAMFRKKILQHLAPETVVLDLGAGAGVVQEMRFRGLCKQICGLDPVPEVLNNGHLEIARQGSGESIPWPDASFDLVYAYNVLEHLSDPAKVFAEVRRVLKPGGVFLVKTPNRWHYVPMIARMTPLWFHRYANELRGRRKCDTFRTFYRANSAGQLLYLAEVSGLQMTGIEEIEGRPEYMRSPLLYPLGLLWERIVNNFQLLSRFRILLMATFTAPLA